MEREVQNGPVISNSRTYRIGNLCRRMFLPLSQFPLTDKGTHEMRVHLEVRQHELVIDEADPFQFTLTIKGEAAKN